MSSHAIRTDAYWFLSLAVSLLSAAAGTAACGGPPTTTDVKLGTPDAPVAVGSHFRVKVPIGVGGHCVPVPLNPPGAGGSPCVPADRGSAELESVDIEPSNRFEVVEFHRDDERIDWLELKALEAGEATLTVEAKGTIEGDSDTDTASTTLVAKQPDGLSLQVLGKCRPAPDPPNVPSTRPFPVEIALEADDEQLEVSHHWFEGDHPDPLVLPDAPEASIVDRSFDPPFPSDGHSLNASVVRYRIEPHPDSRQADFPPLELTSGLDDDWSQTIAFAQPGDIDGLEVERAVQSSPIEMCTEIDNLCPKAFQVDFRRDGERFLCPFPFVVTTQTSETCRVAVGRRNELFDSHRFDPVDHHAQGFGIAGRETGTCKFDVTVPEAADGEGVSQQLEFPVTERK